MTEITVIKKDLEGREVWRYRGRLRSRAANQLVLEARFNRPDADFHGVVLARGDRFVETFYSDRWYNIFEIYDRRDGRLKGWYCNVGYPAVFDGDQISYVDLALDLLVYPDGRQLVLDEDEFDALPLSRQDRQRALEALAALKQTFKRS